MASSSTPPTLTVQLIPTADAPSPKGAVPTGATGLTAPPPGSAPLTPPNMPGVGPLQGGQPAGTFPPPGAALPGPNAPGMGPSGAGGFPGGPGGPMGAAPGGHGPPNLKKINPYIYIPSFSMAIVGSMAFLITSGLHLFQVIKYKSWYFAIVTQAVLMSAAAMIARTHSIMTLKDTGATGPFMIFMMLDMIGPTLLVIGNVFTMTRVIWWVTPNERRNFQTLKAPPMVMSLIWVGTFSIADIGKAIGQHVFKPQDPLGMKIQEIGQVFQFFILASFTLWAWRFMSISRRWRVHAEAEEKRWRSLGWTVVTVSALLTIRWLFTVVGMDARADPRSFFSQHEWIMWVSEELPVFLSYALYNVNFPGAFFPREYTGFRIKLKEIEKKKLESPWPLTISSPIRTPMDDKTVEITLTDLETGRMDGRSHPAHR